MGLTQLLDHVLKLRGNERVMAGQDGAAMLRALVAAGLEQGDQEAIEVDVSRRSHDHDKEGPVVRTNRVERRASLATVESHNSDFCALLCV
jgi:hypothetical protein